jgi:hypothetical protein
MHSNGRRWRWSDYFLSVLSSLSLALMQEVDTMPLGTCVKLNEEGTETPPPSASDLLRRVPEEFTFQWHRGNRHLHTALRKFLLPTSRVPRGRCLAQVLSSRHRCSFSAPKIHPSQLLELHHLCHF